MKPYDAAMKQLLDEYAIDWIEWIGPLLGLPATTPLKPLDTDLSIVQFTPDKVFELQPAELGILHLEMQTSFDAQMPGRMLIYNTLLEHKHEKPVYSVLILLRPEANAKTITGELIRKYHDDRVYKQFQYEVIRVWELPGEELLRGHWGTVPLAFLTDDAKGHLKEWVSQLEQRCDQESISESMRRSLLLCSCILTGMRYNEDEIDAAFPGVNAMKESVIYQRILKEGRLEGRQEGRLEGLQEGDEEGQIKACQRTLVNILQKQFGELDPAFLQRIHQIKDVAKLDAATMKTFDGIESLDELQL